MVEQMEEHRLEGALLNTVRGILKGDKTLYLEAAYSFEKIVESGDIPKRLEFLFTLFSALSYDIADEVYDAERQYRRLFKMEYLDLKEVVGSEKHSKLLSDAISHLGLREIKPFQNLFSEIVNFLHNKKQLTGEVVDENYEDDYNVLLSTLTLAGNFFSASRKTGEDLKKIIADSKSLSSDLSKFEPAAWIELLSLLYVELIRSVGEKSVLNLELPKPVQEILMNNARFELWKPQMQAVKSGLLSGDNVVYSSPTGTGKSFLAYVSIGMLEENKQAIYAVPTRSLSSQVYSDLISFSKPRLKIAVSDRDKTENDEFLDQMDVLVTTYEKLDGLLRRGKIDESRIQTVIVDELHYLGDPHRGLTLEFLLTRFKEMKNLPPQLITLSALMSRDDVEDIADWLRAKPVRSDWRGVRVDEMIYFDGNLHYKDGRVQQAEIIPDKNLAAVKQREMICSFYAKKAITKSQSLLISANSRDTVSKLANELNNRIGTYNFLEPDLLDASNKKRSLYEKVAESIRLVEPELPLFAQELLNMVQNGIAYHHAGLPIKYRSIIENALLKNQLDVIVATSTLEAGVNFPIKTVLFYEPRFFNYYSKKYINMNNRTYQNIAGRAGRPGFHNPGEVLVISLKREEFQGYKEKFWNSDFEQINSSFGELIKSNKLIESSLHSQLLGFIVSKEETNTKEIKSYIASTWFWKHIKSQGYKDMVENSVFKHLDKLKEAEFVNILENVITPTQIGRKINESMLSPFSASVLMKCTKYISESNLEDEEKIIFLLVISGLPVEVSNNDSLVQRAVVPDYMEKFRKILKEIIDPTLDLERIEIALRYGTVLYQWINSLPSTEILELCGRENKSDSAKLEEGLAKDAQWILSRLATIASMTEADENIISLVSKISEYCRYGTRDALLLRLLTSSLDHIGRTTALKLKRILDVTTLDFSSVTEKRFLDFFASNKESAKLLFQELWNNPVIFYPQLLSNSQLMTQALSQEDYRLVIAAGAAHLESLVRDIATRLTNFNYLNVGLNTLLNDLETKNILGQQLLFELSEALKLRSEIAHMKREDFSNEVSRFVKSVEKFDKIQNDLINQNLERK